jgi:hypothetical protein
MENMPMTIRKVTTGLLVLSLVVSAVPALAETPATSPAGTAAPTTLRASVDRAIASASIAPAQSNEAQAPRALRLPTRFASKSTASQDPTGGGGGGKTMMIVGILGTVAGLAGTYFIIKETKKSTDAATAAAGQ